MRYNDERQQATNADGRRSVSFPDRLVVASNRQPYRHEFADDESDGSGSSGSTSPGDVAADDHGAVEEHRPPDDRAISVDEPAGGLTAGLDPVLADVGGTWVAWGDGDADRLVTDADDCVRVPPDDPSYTLRRVWLSDEAVDGYYYGFSNRVLWPLCHGFPSLVEHRDADRRWYRRVNRTFADAVLEEAADDAVVWLQDYHFALAPAMVREGLPPSATVAQFWHIPWPSPRVFRRCPDGRELLEGLLGNDLLGFHVGRYADAFLECVETSIPSATVDYRDRSVEYDGSVTRTVAEPMGVDATAIDERARALEGTRWADFREEYDVPADVTIGLGVDRLDYSKGIPQRLDALERFFERYPEWRGAFTFVQKSTPSRTDIPAYRRHGERVRRRVDEINDRFATDDWRPIVYTEDVLPRETLDALYRRADVMVVSPLCDGMNLVAQEFVAASVDCDGTLVLSEHAGAHETLGRDAFSIEPDRTEAFASTIRAAATTHPSERRARMSSLRREVFDRDLDSWMASMFDDIARVHDEPSGRLRQDTGYRSV